MSAPEDLRPDHSGDAGRSAVRGALRADADAATAIDVDAVWDRVSTRITRRHRRRQALGVAGAALAVAGAALGSHLLDTGGQQPVPPAAASTTSAATSAPTSAPTSATRLADRVPLTDVPFAHTPAQAREAFTAAGYGRADAARLGLVWRWGDADQVAVVAGSHLLDGRALPLAPGQDASAAPSGQPELYRTQVAYARAGYTDADAAALAARWGETSTALVEVYVGQLILDGDVPAR